MRVVDIRERSVDLSRYSDPSIPSGGLTTSIVALTTDVVRNGRPVVGYGFSSMGRFAQSGLIRERFAPRLLAAVDVDPLTAWAAMMKGEKPGGHGERCVAVGTLDMALWDAAAKIAELPLHQLLRQRFGNTTTPVDVPAYASGGYLYPDDDLGRLRTEMHLLRDQGYDKVKIKIGAVPLAQDLKRIEVALRVFPGPHCVAVDAMNVYDARQSLDAAKALSRHRLMWFEDICDPLDFDTQALVAAAYDEPIAAGEALFSAAEALLLDRHGGLRRDRDVLLFDPVHCYGLPGYLRIIEALAARGWSRRSFWPHGGHLFSLHVASALGLGGVEVNPLSFPPFGGLADGATIAKGHVTPPDTPGIGFEGKADLTALFGTL
ncbi:MAG: enolase C-terminal domain-like protein [Reyranella sp.]|uniref:enolase C-terminal domain-like protein n=1 Tax=Reyranella sp. TaxID=1929291 RepID=UPI002730355D|nr:enolase C-terminal domain-like protein [Reyranella sp.]MDP1966419.1 enolase C-terminal domain-like protein [Reyranella sp.]MDP2374121.1 enolase C-terminal domain-like protein [Reyranella sp.]